MPGTAPPHPAPPPPILTVGPAPPFIDGVVTVESFPIDAVELDMERVVDVGTGEPSSFSPKGPIKE